MFELVFLGTSASTPSAHRGLSAHMVMHRQYRFLIDCGEGTQRQILRAGLGFKRLDKVLLTHSHLDHILGLGGLVSTLARWEAMEHFDIYGGRSTLRRVRDLVFGVALRGDKTPVTVNLIELKPGMIILEDEKFVLSAFPVQHRGNGCFGFSFEEKARRPFLEDKAATLNVPFGPERGQLVRGEPVTLSDGRVIQPDDVLGEEIPGTKYVHIGDLGSTRHLADICRDADTLVVEATYTEEEADMAKQFGHLTAAQGARLAKEANVKSLILTHISRRHTAREIRQEARAIFPNTFVARDFDHFMITREGAQKQTADKRQQTSG
ncbi:MAG: ribonuclease Z [Ardenticatenaceae bacterium]|nr:ribonuclease Z [Ardenticatenaceae bacterium]